MIRVSVTVTFFVLLGLHSRQVFSKTHEGGLHHRSHSEEARLTRYPRDVRSHRETRQSNANETRCKYYMAMLDFPPYVMNTSTTQEKGPMYEKTAFFAERQCFGLERDDPVPCHLESIFCQSSDKIIELIQERRVDFAFPIQADEKEKLEDDPQVTIIQVFVSLGCSLIVNTKQCEEESREQLLTSITSQWPIFACIILLSGISGMVIWILVKHINTCFFLIRVIQFSQRKAQHFFQLCLVLLCVFAYNHRPYFNKTTTSKTGSCVFYACSIVYRLSHLKYLQGFLLVVTRLVESLYTF